MHSYFMKIVLSEISMQSYYKHLYIKWSWLVELKFGFLDIQFQINVWEWDKRQSAEIRTSWDFGIPL